MKEILFCRCKNVGGIYCYCSSPDLFRAERFFSRFMNYNGAEKVKWRIPESPNQSDGTRERVTISSSYLGKYRIIEFLDETFFNVSISQMFVNSGG